MAEEFDAFRRHDLGSALRQDLTRIDGPSIGFGIMLAGGLYPVVLAAIYLIVLIVAVVWSFPNSPVDGWLQLAVIPFATAAYAAFAAVIGTVWAALVSLVTLPVVYLFVRSLKICGSVVWLGAAAGGLVGFVAVLPLTLAIPWINPALDAWAIVLLILVGPGLATILGQLGGAWGGRRAERYAAHYYGLALALESDEPPPPESENAGHQNSRPTPQPHFQFRIHHMLWIVVWLSLVLSLIRLSGLPLEFVLPLVVGWLVFQSATLLAGAQFAKWRDRRRAARQPFHVELSAN